MRLATRATKAGHRSLGVTVVVTQDVGPCVWAPHLASPPRAPSAMLHSPPLRTSQTPPAAAPLPVTQGTGTVTLRAHSLGDGMMEQMKLSPCPTLTLQPPSPASRRADPGSPRVGSGRRWGAEPWRAGAESPRRWWAPRLPRGRKALRGPAWCTRVCVRACECMHPLLPARAGASHIWGPRAQLQAGSSHMEELPEQSW